MSNTNSRSNKETSRGTGSGRAWQSRGRGQTRGLSNTPLKERTSIPQAAATDAQQPGATKKASPSDTRRRMHLMASVSRSSGLQKDGDELVFPFKLQAG